MTALTTYDRGEQTLGTPTVEARAQAEVGRVFRVEKSNLGNFTPKYLLSRQDPVFSYLARIKSVSCGSPELIIAVMLYLLLIPKAW